MTSTIPISSTTYIMKFILLPLVLSLLTDLCAEDEIVRHPKAAGAEEKVVQDPLIVRSLGRLEERLGIRFNIPFPKEFDCDAYKKQPLALMTVDRSKVCITRPIVNPFDEPRTVEWMMGPEDPKKLGNEFIESAFDLDERGEFSRVNLQADWTSVGGNHLLDRGDDESGRDFFERARLTYRDRAGKAQDPARAKLFLTVFEKMARTIQALRQEEARAVPGAPPR